MKEVIIITVKSEYGIADDLIRAIKSMVSEWEGIEKIAFKVKEEE